jgi:RND superfamily putative drug exporter
MLIPIALAISALVTAFLLLYILAGLTDINTITPILVSMIGLGVGIDYSLFIVTRFRQLLHEGLPPREAAAQAGAALRRGRARTPGPLRSSLNKRRPRAARGV